MPVTSVQTQLLIMFPRVNQVTIYTQMWVSSFGGVDIHFILFWLTMFKANSTAGVINLKLVCLRKKNVEPIVRNC